VTFYCSWTRTASVYIHFACANVAESSLELLEVIRTDYSGKVCFVRMLGLNVNGRSMSFLVSDTTLTFMDKDLNVQITFFLEEKSKE
jgi:hypothetical protein